MKTKKLFLAAGLLTFATGCDNNATTPPEKRAPKTSYGQAVERAKKLDADMGARDDEAKKQAEELFERE